MMRDSLLGLGCVFFNKRCEEGECYFRQCEKDERNVKLQTDLVTA